MKMRPVAPLLCLALATLLASESRVDARPEFARREGRACGYCHINPRGGGARNARGIEYARNEFKFPPRKGDLTVFVRERDRKAMIHARALVDIDHVKAAVAELKKLAKSAKGKDAKLAAREELHELDVRGAEILGAARRMLRKSEPDEAVELLVMLVHEFKGLDVYDQAREDLRELGREKTYKELIAAEQVEAKARLMFLDGLRYEREKKAERAKKAFDKVLEAYPDTRAAKQIRKLRRPDDKDDESG
jgi:tetratricopeptide (TPR) repeat protein